MKLYLLLASYVYCNHFYHALRRNQLDESSNEPLWMGRPFQHFFISTEDFVLKTAKRWKYWHGCRRSMSAWLESIICIMGLIINTEWHTIEFLELKPNKDLFKTVGFWILYSWWLLTRQVLAWLLNQKLTVHTQVKFRTVHESFCVFNDFTGDFRS